jgi:hypothetical protein
MGPKITNLAFVRPNFFLNSVGFVLSVLYFFEKDILIDRIFKKYGIFPTNESNS